MAAFDPEGTFGLLDNSHSFQMSRSAFSAVPRTALTFLGETFGLSPNPDKHTPPN